MNFHITLKSNNAKVGPIPVTTTAQTSCPTACPLIESCYAKQGPLAMHWRAVTEGKRGGDLEALCETIAALPEGQLWRHNQAGDLPGEGNSIDAESLRKLVKANKGKRGFTYTHKPMTAENAALVAEANAEGFRVSLSANDLSHADELAALNVGPVVTILPIEYQRQVVKGEFVESMEAYRARVAELPQSTPEGRRVTVCPATSRDNVNCASCQLCARERDVIIGFPAHGSRAKKVSQEIRVHKSA